MRRPRRDRGEAPREERAPGRLQPGPGARRAFVRRFVRGRCSPQGVCDWCQSLGSPGPTGEFEPGTRGALSRASASSFPCAQPGPRLGNSGPSWTPLPGTQAGSSQREPAPPDWGLMRGVGELVCIGASFRSRRVKRNSHPGWPEVTPLGEGARRVVWRVLAVTASGVCLTD